MKILFYIESMRSGGKERRLAELIKALLSNPAIEMQLVLTRDDNIHYEEILSSNIKIHYTIRKGMKKDPRIFYKFYKIAKNFRPDIIHVWGNLVAIYAIPAKVLLKIPMINNQITDAPLVVSNSLLGHKLTFPFSNKIISNSIAGLASYNAPKNKSSVIYNGFQFNRISNLERIEVVREEFNIITKYVVGMVASFTDLKDYQTYIKAANKVLAEKFDITFLCIGSGDDNIYKEMVDIDNKDRILFLGKQNNVERLMNICDIGVLMSNPDKHGEGISNALLEFAALGKPTIASFGGGNGELITQGVSGFLVNPKSINELADNIMVLINDEKRRLSFGEMGRKRVIEDFSIEKMTNQFLIEYKAIVKSSKL